MRTILGGEPALGQHVRWNERAPSMLESLDDRSEAELEPPRFVALVVGGFSALATLLAAVGLFSVLVYMVGQRRRELAVRLPLVNRGTLIAFGASVRRGGAYEGAHRLWDH